MKPPLKQIEEYDSLPPSGQQSLLADLAELMEFRRNPHFADEIEFNDPEIRKMCSRLSDDEVDSIVEWLAKRVLRNDDESNANRATAAFAIGKCDSKSGFKHVVDAFKLENIGGDVRRQMAIAFENLAELEDVVLPSEIDTLMRKQNIPWDATNQKIIIDDA